MNIKTNLIEEYVNFVDTTKRRYKKTMGIYNYTCFYTVYTYNYTSIYIYK